MKKRDTMRDKKQNEIMGSDSFNGSMTDTHNYVHLLMTKSQIWLSPIHLFDLHFAPFNLSIFLETVCKLISRPILKLNKPMRS